MTDRPARPAAFTLERVPAAPVPRVWSAWPEPAATARWFFGPPGKWPEQARVLDLRVGGREHRRGAMAGGPVSRFDATYYDIVPAERIVYAYEMHLDATRICVSLAPLDAGACTRMRFTEQAVFLDGYADSGGRERGTNGLLDQLRARSGRRAPTVTAQGAIGARGPVAVN